MALAGRFLPRISRCAFTVTARVACRTRLAARALAGRPTSRSRRQRGLREASAAGLGWPSRGSPRLLWGTRSLSQAADGKAEAEAEADQAKAKAEEAKARHAYEMRHRLRRYDTLQGMLRVDHAGEYGAVRIYDGQLAVLRNDPETAKQLTVRIRSATMPLSPLN